MCGHGLERGEIEAGSSVGGCCITSRGRRLEQVGSRQDMLMDWEGGREGEADLARAQHVRKVEKGVERECGVGWWKSLDLYLWGSRTAFDSPRQFFGGGVILTRF